MIHILTTCIAGTLVSQAFAQSSAQPSEAFHQQGQAAAKSREAKFGAIMIPIYQLDNASLKEALEALSLIIEKQTQGEVIPNFIIEDPTDRFSGRKITLNLKTMPARAVMKYLTDQAGAKVRHDEHAIVIAAK